MGVSYRILPELNLVAVRYSGRLTTHDNVQSILEYTRDPQFDTGHNFFLDFSEGTEFDIDFPQMLSMVAKLMPVYTGRKSSSLTAIYAPSDIAFGVARMYESLRDMQAPNQMGVYRDFDEVRAFLSLGDVGRRALHGLND
ncbi:MAG: hypothetical protein QNJ09_01730 [Paracoccaceae bacterium]|nr:hypothetical protein [Paracoccaceae bacterium]